METSLLFQHWGVWNQLLGSPPAEISPGLSPVHAEESSDMSPLQRTIFRHGSSPKTALICTKEEPLAVPPAPPPSPLVPAGAGTGVRLLPSCSPAKPRLCGAFFGCGGLCPLLAWVTFPTVMQEPSGKHLQSLNPWEFCRCLRGAGIALGTAGDSCC